MAGGEVSSFVMMREPPSGGSEQNLGTSAMGRSAPFGGGANVRKPEASQRPVVALFGGEATADAALAGPQPSQSVNSTFRTDPSPWPPPKPKFET